MAFSAKPGYKKLAISAEGGIHDYLMERSRVEVNEIII